jgi:glucose-6-phosphate 1-dehydrogenase
VIDRLVVFGGTGDLMGRYLLPGLAALQARGQLPEGFELIGAARDDWDDEHYRDWAAGWLESQPGGEGAALLRAEEGVTPEHGTETFAEVLLELDSWRWSGTRFRLRTGKALGHDRMEIVVHFRAVPHNPFDRSDGPAPNRLRFEVEPEGLSLELTGTGPDATLSLVPLVLRAELQPPELPAYARILLDVLAGDSTLSIRGDEAEEAWRIVTPVLDGWARNLAPLEEYEAGSQGPEGRVLT